MYRNSPILRRTSNELNKEIPPSTIGIHGKLYDIKTFVHPGGDAFLKIAEETDATSLFETHHINIKRAEIVLSTIEPKGNYEYHKFSWDSYNTLRNTVFTIFPTRKSRRMNVKTLNYLLSPPLLYTNSFPI